MTTYVDRTSTHYGVDRIFSSPTARALYENLLAAAEGAVLGTTGLYGWAISKIGSAVASSHASLSFSAGITNAYEAYLILLSKFLPATNDVDLHLHMSTDGGASYDTATNYGFNNTIQGTVNRSLDTATTVELARRISNTVNGGGVSGQVIVYAPAAAEYKHVTHALAGYGWTGAADTTLSCVGGGVYRSTAAVDALRLRMTSGNIASGSAHLFGMNRA